MYAYEDDCGVIFLQRSKQLHRDLFGVIITGLQILPPISFLPTFTALKTTSCRTTHLTSTSPSTTSFATAQSTTYAPPSSAQDSSLHCTFNSSMFRKRVAGYFKQCNDNFKTEKPLKDHLKIFPDESIRPKVHATTGKLDLGMGGNKKITKERQINKACKRQQTNKETNK